MEQEILNEILAKHKLWLNNEDNGERANLTSANLTSADLTNANLTNANLTNADLTNADLTSANLRSANLNSADLFGANLNSADLFGANLTSANLRSANLFGTIGNMAELKSGQFEKYSFAYTNQILQIGCENHTITDWWSFDDRTINAMDHGALKWWRVWKPILKQIIETSPAVPTGLKS